MANNQAQSDQALHGLRAMYENNPSGYFGAIQNAGDQDTFGTPNFLGGPGGVIAHNFQTVLDSAQLQADAQGKQLKFDPHGMPGQAPLPRTNTDQLLGLLKAHDQNNAAPRANFYPNATNYPYKPF